MNGIYQGRIKANTEGSTLKNTKLIKVQQDKYMDVSTRASDIPMTAFFASTNLAINE